MWTAISMALLAGSSRAQPTMKSSASRSRSRSWNGKGSRVSNSWEILSTLSAIRPEFGVGTVSVILFACALRTAGQDCGTGGRSHAYFLCRNPCSGGAVRPRRARAAAGPGAPDRAGRQAQPRIHGASHALHPRLRDCRSVAALPFLREFLPQFSDPPSAWNSELESLPLVWLTRPAAPRVVRLRTVTLSQTQYCHGPASRTSDSLDGMAAKSGPSMNTAWKMDGPDRRPINVYSEMAGRPGHDR